MKRLSPRRLFSILIIAAVALSTAGCGTIRTHWGMEHEYNYDFDHDDHHGHHKKHKKHKKHHGKDYRDHHHDDDD